MALLILLVLPVLAGCTSPAPLTEAELVWPLEVPAAPLPRADWVQEVPRGIASIRSSPDGSVVAVAASQYTIGVTLRSIEADSGATLLEHVYPYQICCLFPPLALSQRADRVLAPGENVTLLSRDGSVLKVVDLPHDPPDEPFPELPVFAEVSEDGSVAAWSTWKDGRVYVQRGTGEPWVRNLDADGEFVAVALTGSGSRVAASSPQRLLLFRADSPNPVRQWNLDDRPQASSGLQDVAISDDGGLIATFRFTKGSLSLLLFGADRWGPIAEAPLEAGFLAVVRMAPNGDWVAAGAPGKRAMLFDRSGRAIADFGPGSLIEDALRWSGKDLLLVYRGDAIGLFEVSGRGARLVASVATEARAFSHALVADGFAALDNHPTNGNVTLVKRYHWEDVAQREP